MANVVEGRVLLTKAELAERLRVSERTVDRWRRLGVIEAVQPPAGGAVRYRAEDVEALLEPEVRPPTARDEELEWSFKNGARSPARIAAKREPIGAGSCAARGSGLATSTRSRSSC